MLWNKKLQFIYWHNLKKCVIIHTKYNLCFFTIKCIPYLLIAATIPDFLFCTLTTVTLAVANGFFIVEGWRGLIATSYLSNVYMYGRIEQISGSGFEFATALTFSVGVSINIIYCCTATHRSRPLVVRSFRNVIIASLVVRTIEMNEFLNIFLMHFL